METNQILAWGGWNMGRKQHNGGFHTSADISIEQDEVYLRFWATSRSKISVWFSGRQLKQATEETLEALGAQLAPRLLAEEERREQFDMKNQKIFQEAGIAP